MNRASIGDLPPASASPLIWVLTQGKIFRGSLRGKPAFLYANLGSTFAHGVSEKVVSCERADVLYIPFECPVPWYAVTRSHACFSLICYLPPLTGLSILFLCIERRFLYLLTACGKLGDFRLGLLFRCSKKRNLYRLTLSFMANIKN